MHIQRPILCSVVSHNQNLEIDRLLKNVQQSYGTKDRLQFVVIENVADTNPLIEGDYDLNLTIVRNKTPTGFSKNHNNALLRFNPEEYESYAILNPDLIISAECIASLALSLSKNPSTGIIAPCIYSSRGELEDSARPLPTPMRILKKLLKGERDGFKSVEEADSAPFYWLAGMCLVVRPDVFDRLRGFDDRFFLYYEDVDFCCRARLAGWRVRIAPHLSAIHDGQRASHRNLRLLVIHLMSMLRFFFGPVYRAMKATSGHLEKPRPSRPW